MSNARFLSKTESPPVVKGKIRPGARERRKVNPEEGLTRKAGGGRGRVDCEGKHRSKEKGRIC